MLDPGPPDGWSKRLWYDPVDRNATRLRDSSSIAWTLEAMRGYGGPKPTEFYHANESRRERFNGVITC